MKKCTKRLFGKKYEFHWARQFDSVLPPSICLYPDAPSHCDPDVRVVISAKLPEFQPASVNPKIHQSALGEMRVHMGSISASWKYTDAGVLAVDVVIPETSDLKRAARKFYSMEYSTEVERFEQLLHELVLVPSVYFFGDAAPIHSAAVATADGTMLLAGTGGVGKSSAVLAFRKQKDIGFIADDISIVSANGQVFGNMAWPKIYGYNCVGNEMARELLRGRSLADQLHFHVKNRLNPSRVRRKLAPDRLYDSVVPDGKPLNTLFYLFREDVPNMALTQLPVESAVEMSIAVMESEYGVFHRHLNWEEYNSFGGNRTPILTMAQVRDKWRAIYRSAFSKAEIIKVGIPLDIDHARYQSEIVKIVTR